MTPLKSVGEAASFLTIDVAGRVVEVSYKFHEL